MRRKLLDRLFTAVTLLAAGVALAILAGLVALVARQGAGALSWRFFTEQIKSVGADGGVFYHIVGTAILMATAAVIALPVAVGVGVFHEVYLPPGRARRWLEAALHALNGIPSIVFGLIGFSLFFQAFGWRKSWLAGGILLGVMILPTVTIAFVEKLRAIPRATIEAATGLGLDRGRLVNAVLIPQAASGLVTGTLLGLARAAGETAPIMFTTVIFSGATVPTGIKDSPLLALPYHIFVLAQDAYDPIVIRNIWGTAIVLLLVVVTLSLIALPLRMKIHEEARRA